MIPSPVSGCAQLTAQVCSAAGNTEADIRPQANQVGWLVVCLPSEFMGGRMTVFNESGEQSAGIEWSAKSSSAIQWVAFPCGCNQTAESIENGYQILLTFMLSLSDRIGCRSSLI